MHRIGRWKIFIMCLAALMVVNGCSVFGDSENVSEEVSLNEEVSRNEEKEETLDEILPEDADTIFVYVCGQVAVPGVYELDTESRVYEAIAAAGGLLETAAAELLNQAEQLTDGQKVYVPSVEESQAQTLDGSVSQGGQLDDGLVNINTAGKEELMTLTGIGEVRAESILSYRGKNGSFHSIEELMNVEGIKEGTYEKIRDRIKI